jgi:hypothetical protein
VILKLKIFFLKFPPPQKFRVLTSKCHVVHEVSEDKVEEEDHIKGV